MRQHANEFQYGMPTPPLIRSCAALVCLLSGAAMGCRDAAPVVRVSLNPWPGYAFLFLAEEKGFFEDEGVAVDLVELASLRDVCRTFELGQTDVMACTLTEALWARQSSARTPLVFLVADYSEGADVLISSTEIAEVAQLKAMNIGLEPASLDVLNVYHALREAGLTMDDVNLVTMAQTEMASALAAGRVDAVQCYPPLSAQLLADTGRHVLYAAHGESAVIVDVLAVDESFARQYPDSIRALRRAYCRAVQYYQAAPQESIAIMARRTGMRPSAFQQALAKITILSETGQRLGEDRAALELAVRNTREAMRACQLLGTESDADVKVWWQLLQ